MPIQAFAHLPNRSSRLCCLFLAPRVAGTSLPGVQQFVVRPSTRCYKLPIEQTQQIRRLLRVLVSMYLDDARVTDISLNNKSSQWSFQQLYHLYKRTVG